MNPKFKVAMTSKGNCITENRPFKIDVRDIIWYHRPFNI